MIFEFEFIKIPVRLREVIAIIVSIGKRYTVPVCHIPV